MILDKKKTYFRGVAALKVEYIIQLSWFSKAKGKMNNKGINGGRKARQMEELSSLQLFLTLWSPAPCIQVCLQFSVLEPGG